MRRPALFRTASIRLRTALALSLLVTAIWLVAAAATARLLRDEMGEVFDSALQETGQRILQLAVIDVLGRETDAPQHIASLSTHDEYFTYVVRDGAGRVLLASHRAAVAAFPPDLADGFGQTATHRTYRESALRGSVVLTIAEPLSHRREVAFEVALALGLPLLLVLPLSIAAIFFGLRYGLSPLDLLRRQVAARHADDLSPLPEEGLPQELRPIAAGMTQLLARLDSAFQAERSFAANAAHELRTPLAGAVMQVQRLRKGTGEPATAAKAAEVEAALKRLAHLAERLLQLSRAEGARLTGEAADLRPLLRLLAEDATRAGADLRLDLPDTPVPSRIDADAVAIIARNLFENARHHGTGPIIARLTPEGWFCVENDCPALSADELARLTRPFARARASAGLAGSGLGLAIVARLADRAGCDLALTSPLSGQDRGFRAAICLMPGVGD